MSDSSSDLSKISHTDTPTKRVNEVDFLPIVFAP